jgi:hypothetical protein
MAVFQMLSKMVGPEKFLGLIAFAKLVDAGQMIKPTMPVRLRKTRKLLSTITTCIGLRTTWTRRWWS